MATPNEAYIPPRVIPHRVETNDPESARETSKSIREEVESNAFLRCAVKPDLVTVVDCERKYVPGFGQFLSTSRLPARGINWQGLR